MPFVLYLAILSILLTGCSVGGAYRMPPGTYAYGFSYGHYRPYGGDFHFRGLYPEYGVGYRLRFPDRYRHSYWPRYRSPRLYHPFDPHRFYGPYRFRDPGIYGRGGLYSRR